jgi:endonuclease I
MPRTVLVAAPLALAFAAAASAQAPPGYYASVDTSTSATLRATLHAVIDDHTRFPYTASGTDTWVILEQADEDPANAAAIVDVYRNASYAKTGGGTGPYDREHSWPKSYGFPNDTAGNYPYTDCHQLFLSDSGYNSSRGNRAYASASAAAIEKITLLTNGSGGGSGSYPGNSNWTDGALVTGRWETWHDRRGDVARALMYMDVRYEGGTHGVTGAVEPDLILTDDAALIAASNTGSNASFAYMGLRSTLVQWHQLDPVDQHERDRNDVVFSFQGNRNPFVDHPEWADCLFGGTCGDVIPPAAPAQLRLVATTGSTSLDWADNTEGDLAGYRVYRATAAGGPYTLLNASLLPGSAYVDVGASLTVRRYYVVRAVDSSGNVSLPSREVVTPALRQPVLASAAPAPLGDVGPGGGGSSAWINELHYDNTGADTGEFVEVAGSNGVDLTGWSLVGYNGATGAVYVTVPLSGVLTNQQNGYGARSFAIAGLQNGAPDGVALVDAGGTVVEFLAYEGTFTAVGGPANGMLATAIPTAESESTPVGFSLQRQGTGHAPAAFTWSAPIAATSGQPNTGQTLQ